MARATTVGELALLAAIGYDVYTKIEIEDPDGVLRDYTSQSGKNWQYAFTVDHDIDQPVGQAQVQMRREIGTVSLSPLRSDSTLNRDGLGAFAPAIDVGRRMKISTACVAFGASVVAGDWKLMFDGLIDDLSTEGPLIMLNARDDGGILVDALFAGSETLNYVANPTAIEDVIQQILDMGDPDNPTALFFPAAVTLYVPTSPSFVITSFGYQVTDTAMDALQRLVQVIGWDLRYRFDDVTSSFLFTLSDPGRATTTPAFTLAVNQLIKINELKIDRANVRNLVTVLFGGEAVPSSSGAADTDSQLRYGLRRITIREATDSAINTQAEANAMASYILADLKDPKTSHNVDMPYFWPVDMNDLIRFAANNQQYDSNLDLAVVGYKHTISSDGGARTTLMTRGAPASGYRTWIARARLGQPINDSARRNIARVTPAGDSADGTARTFRVVCGADVDALHVHYRTALISAAGDPLDFSASPNFTDTTPGDPVTLVIAPDTNHVVTLTMPLPARDYRLSYRLVPFYGLREGDSWPGHIDASSSVQSSIIAGPSSANNGQTATVSATFNANTAIGANCARYSLDGGASWTLLTVLFTRVVDFTVTRILNVKQTVIVQGLNAVDGAWGDQGTCSVDAYTSDGPSLNAEYRATDSVSGNVYWACPQGVVTVEIDGGAPSTPSASPIPISLTGSTHSYLFKATQAGQIVSVNVLVPALPGPSMYAVYLATNSLTGTIVWACPAGTPTVEIDGAAPATPSASPIAITLDGNTHSYLFKAIQAGQTTAVNVLVPSLASTAGPQPVIDSFYSPSNGQFNFAQHTTTDIIDLVWSARNVPTGATYDLEWSYNGGGYTTISGVTSPYSHGPASHGLDLVNGGTASPMRYTLILKASGGNELTVSTLEVEVDHA